MDLWGWPNLRAIRILVVEDEFLVAEEMAELIHECGGTVVGPASTVDRALRLIEQDRPDAVLLDAFLLSETAIPIADRLRGLRVPFVVVTGYDCERLPKPLLDVPCIAKPYEPRTLMLAIARELEMARRPGAVGAQP
jgi:DNA-binding response OmpR family regulator